MVNDRERNNYKTILDRQNFDKNNFHDKFYDDFYNNNNINNLNNFNNNFYNNNYYNTKPNYSNYDRGIQRSRNGVQDWQTNIHNPPPLSSFGRKPANECKIKEHPEHLNIKCTVIQEKLKNGIEWTETLKWLTEYAGLNFNEKETKIKIVTRLVSSMILECPDFWEQLFTMAWRHKHRDLGQHIAIYLPGMSKHLKIIDKILMCSITNEFSNKRITWKNIMLLNKWRFFLSKWRGELWIRHYWKHTMET
jgi:hypothetical protein